MKPGMKMLMISNRENGRNSDSRYGNYRYDSERYSPRNDYTEDNYDMRMGMDDPESRRRYRRDSRGRFRSEWDDEETRMGDIESRREYSNYGNEARMGGYPNRPFPVYEAGRSNMNQIGFNAGGEIRTDYGMNATHRTGSEMQYRSSPQMSGGYSSNMSTPMTKEIAEEWTAGMKNEDGTKGPHWKMEQVKQVMAQKGIQCDPYEFFAILNAVYSDYCSVFKKHGVNTIDMYVDTACAWLNDHDAMPDKASRYYEFIVKK